MTVLHAIAADLRAHPVLCRMLVMSACAAFGSALPDILNIAGRLL